MSLPDSVTQIGSSAFAGCKSLSSVHLPDSVICIGPSKNDRAPPFFAVLRRYRRATGSAVDGEGWIAAPEGVLERSLRGVDPFAPRG